jgi:hypothetical protein
LPEASNFEFEKIQSPPFSRPLKNGVGFDMDLNKKIPFLIGRNP